MQLLNNNTTYQLHPSIILSIAEHYQRRSADRQRVLGALLGQVGSEDHHQQQQQQQEMEISHSFPVPHSEVDTQVTFNTEHFRSRLDLHRRSAPSKQAASVIGWYYACEGEFEADGEPSHAFPSANTQFFHEFFVKEASTQPVLMVEVRLGSAQPKARAWVLAEMGTWQPVSLSFKVYLAENHLFTMLRRNLLSQSDKVHRLVGEAQLTSVAVEPLSLAHLQAGYKEMEGAMSHPNSVEGYRQAMSQIASQTDDAIDRAQVAKDIVVLKQAIARLQSQLPALRQLELEVEAKVDSSSSS